MSILRISKNPYSESMLFPMIQVCLHPGAGLLVRSDASHEHHDSRIFVHSLHVQDVSLAERVSYQAGRLQGLGSGVHETLRF
jgi:hypothetical protein